MEPVQFIGLKELEDVDQQMVQTLTDEYYGKIQRELNNVTSLVIHIKQHAREGHRHRYEISVRAVAPTRIFESSKGGQTTDWDLSSALHKAFKDVIKQIQHAFKD